MTVSVDHDLKQDNLETTLMNAFGEAPYGITNRTIHLDLSKSYWYDLGVALWLISLLHKLQRQHNDVQLVLPDPSHSTKATNLWGFLFRWRFFDALSICVTDASNLLPADQQQYLAQDSPLRLRYSVESPHLVGEGREEAFRALRRLLEITAVGLVPNVIDENVDPLGTFLQNCNDRVLVTSISKHCGWQREQAEDFAERVVSEGVLNASFHHADGSFALVAMRLDLRWLTLVIADNGLGIPHALRSSAMKLKPQTTDAELIEYYTDPDFVLASFTDSEIIKLSTQSGVTSLEGRKGVGLYYLKKHVLDQHGELRIRSGRACVDFTSDGVDSSDTWPESPGTMLRVRLPIRPAE